MTVFEQLLDRQVTYIAELPPQRKDAIMLAAHDAEAFNSVNGLARAVQIEWVWSPTTMPESSALRATTWRDVVVVRVKGPHPLGPTPCGPRNNR